MDYKNQGKAGVPKQPNKNLDQPKLSHCKAGRNYSGSTEEFVALMAATVCDGIILV